MTKLAEIALIFCVAMPRLGFATEAAVHPCRTFALTDGKEEYVACLKYLEAKNQERFLDINVGAGNWVNEDLLSLICGQIKVVGNPKAINVGFLLAPLLDGAFAEAVYGALGESTERNPKAFLTALQSTMKMYKKKKKDEMFYKYDFRYISAQTDLEYVDQPELEVAAYRKRKKILSGIRNSDLKEARDYSLKVLDDGIMELSQHVEN